MKLTSTSSTSPIELIDAVQAAGLKRSKNDIGEESYSYLSGSLLSLIGIILIEHPKAQATVKNYIAQSEEPRLIVENGTAEISPATEELVKAATTKPKLGLTAREQALLNAIDDCTDAFDARDMLRCAPRTDRIAIARHLGVLFPMLPQAITDRVNARLQQAA